MRESGLPMSWHVFTFLDINYEKTFKMSTFYMFFKMNITVYSSKTFFINTADNYLPNGAYKIYALDSNYGFANVTNSTYLIQ